MQNVANNEKILTPFWWTMNNLSVPLVVWNIQNFKYVK